MSIDIEVQSTGWENVIDGLTLVSLRVDGDLILEDLQEIAQRTLELARETVPVKTGNLRDSLQIIIDPITKSVVIGTDIGYGRYVELGTSKMQSRPFLIPSLVTALTEFQQRYPEKITGVRR